MMVSAGPRPREDSRGGGGWVRGLRTHTHPDPHPADEKEPEVDYRTVVVNTDQKVSDFYDIEERLGS